MNIKLEDSAIVIGMAIATVIVAVFLMIAEALPTKDRYYAETPAELRNLIRLCNKELDGFVSFHGDKENGWTVVCEYRD